VGDVGLRVLLRGLERPDWKAIKSGNIQLGKGGENVASQALEKARWSAIVNRWTASISRLALNAFEIDYRSDEASSVEYVLRQFFNWFLFDHVPASAISPIDTGRPKSFHPMDVKAPRGRGCADELQDAHKVSESIELIEFRPKRPITCVD
jgi:hypothetical protein